MLSGIGDPQQLGCHGIETRIALPGVGQNLQDHISYLARYSRRTESPFQKNMRVDKLARSAMAAYLFGKGFASDVPIGVTAFVKSEPAAVIPDIQLLFLAAPFPTRPHLAPLIQPMPDGFGCRVALLRPQSRGEVSLKSSNPVDPPRIKLNLLSTEKDRSTIRRTLGLLREIAAQPSMAAFVDKEVSPGPQVVRDDEIDAFIRATGVTVHHPVGTCRMGAAFDHGAVVDSALCVRGVSHLRIVDASVMPDIVGGNTNAAVVMIAEKAAEIMRGTL